LRRFRAAVPGFAELGYRQPGGLAAGGSAAAWAACRAGGECPQLSEKLLARRAAGHGAGGQREHLSLQCVDGGVFMGPRVGQLPGVERLDQRLHLGQFQQLRALGDEQPDRVLDRGDIRHQAQFVDLGQEAQVPVERGPWREGDERRVERDAQFTQCSYHGDEVGPGMALVEDLQDALVD
jgi:hypothetical protein